jgi:hypothetical protein
VACQAVRRDSSGCVEERVGLAVLAETGVVGFWRDVRRVSCRPGAEGAPRGREEEEGVERTDLEVVLFVEVAWGAGGAMRRDCWDRELVRKREERFWEVGVPFWKGETQGMDVVVGDEDADVKCVEGRTLGSAKVRRFLLMKAELLQ